MVGRREGGERLQTPHSRDGFFPSLVTYSRPSPSKLISGTGRPPALRAPTISTGSGIPSNDFLDTAAIGRTKLFVHERDSIVKAYC